MASVAQAEAVGLSFWQKMAFGISLFIVFGFVQFAARGFVDFAKVPVWIHLHGIVMLSWLALTVSQPSLIQRGNVTLHRKLGWLGVALAAGVCAFGSAAGILSLKTQHVPPFFTPPYFLALTQIGIAVFAGMIVAAVLNRRRTDWHQRLMLGATILIMEPALGRVLPMPLIMPWGEWLVMVIQLGVLALVMRHDRRTIGVLHPATLAVAVVIVLSHLVVELLAITPDWIAFAGRVAGG